MATLPGPTRLRVTVPRRCPPTTRLCAATGLGVLGRAARRATIQGTLHRQKVRPKGNVSRRAVRQSSSLSKDFTSKELCTFSLHSVQIYAKSGTTGIWRYDPSLGRKSLEVAFCPFLFSSLITGGREMVEEAFTRITTPAAAGPVTSGRRKQGKREGVKAREVRGRAVASRERARPQAVEGNVWPGRDGVSVEEDAGAHGQAARTEEREDEAKG